MCDTCTMPAYRSIKTYMSRLQKKMSFRRKAVQPRLVISEPFNFKKEDSIGVLPGVSSEELSMMREKAVASIVGSGLSPYAYPDSPLLPPSRGRSETSRHLARARTSSSAATAGSSGTAQTRGSSHPGRCCHRHYHTRSVSGPMSFHPVVLSSTQPYAPSGLRSPSSSSASSIHSLGRE